MPFFDGLRDKLRVVEVEVVVALLLLRRVSSAGEPSLDVVRLTDSVNRDRLLKELS